MNIFIKNKYTRKSSKSGGGWGDPHHQFKNVLKNELCTCNGLLIKNKS